MKNRIRKIAVAAIVIVAVLLTISIFEESVTPAYAFEQTIDAIKRVKTVHMAGEFYWQGKFECWLRFDGNPDVPTHMWLGLPRGHLGMVMVCSPDGLFHFNRTTNYVFPISQDQRGRKWIIKFNSFFEDAVNEIVDVQNGSFGREGERCGRDVSIADQLRRIQLASPNSFYFLALACREIGERGNAGGCDQHGRRHADGHERYGRHIHRRDGHGHDQHGCGDGGHG